MIVESEFCPACEGEMILESTDLNDMRWKLEWFCARDEIRKDVVIESDSETPEEDDEDDEFLHLQEDVELIEYLQGEFVQRTGMELEEFEGFVLNAIANHDIYKK